MSQSSPTNSTLSAAWSQLFVLSDAERAGFPNRLALPQGSRQLASAWKTLLVLLSLALGPRLVVAYRIPTPCLDGTNYIRLAQAWTEGNYAPESIYNFNLYPPILAALHGLGFSWEAAAKTWGVLCGTLVVLPLFGWVRRQFNDRVAVVSCLLYAGHAELVQWSAEMVRDQTFWLLFTTCLYYQWRAVCDLRLRHFAAVGLLLPLSALVRFEGAFLALPLLSWSATRRRHACGAERRQLALGFALALVVPIALAASAIIASDITSFERIIYSAPWKRVAVWWQTATGTAEWITPAAILGYDARLVSADLAWRFVDVMQRGLDGPFVVLLLIGFVTNARLFVRCDHRSILLLGGIIAASIWIHSWYTGGASSRYALSIVILEARCAALGVMWLGSQLEMLGGRLAALLRPPAGFNLSRVVPLVIVALGYHAALRTDFSGRRDVAELGERIRVSCPAARVIAGSEEQTPLIGYYARADVKPLTLRAEPALLLAEIERSGADVVVLSASRALPEGIAAVRAAGSKLGLHEADLSSYPRLSRQMVVFSRTPLLR